MSSENGTEASENMTCKTCDQCRSRKVRCIMPPGQRIRCTNCIKRKETCHFPPSKRKLRKCATETNHATSSQHQGPLFEPPSEQIRIQTSLPPVFLDQMLENHGTTGVFRDTNPLLRAPDHDVTSSSLAFFSERRIRSLSQQLGNDRLNQLVETIESIIRSRLLAQGPSSSPISFKHPSDIEQVSLERIRLYTDSYFNQLHPTYPFLDRHTFEDKVFGPSLSEDLCANSAFSALYHTVLALGCQYHEGGAFDPGNGKAWKLFQVSLGLVSDILMPRGTLMGLQALIAMSIFAMTTCCLQIDEVLLMEATRMAQGLGYHRALATGDQRHKNTCHRTFWVLYYMEKQMAFHGNKSSMISDYDIGCPIPDVPESVFGEYNWFLSAIKFGRILSQAYACVFSVSAAFQTTEAHHIAIDEIEGRLEKWRIAVPVGFRPGMPLLDPNCLSSFFPQPSFKMIVLHTNFSYYALTIALSRLNVSVSRQTHSLRQEKSKRLLMYTARAIVEGSKYVDMAAYTPNFILAVLPLAALFILFDFVVHNPTHPETRNNLALLDVAAGHFSLLDYKSGGFLPGSILTEFSHIARQFVKDFDINQLRPPQQEPTEMGSSITGFTSVDTEISMQPNETNSNDSNNTGLQDNMIESWSPRDFLNYPITPETTLHGVPDNPRTTQYNIQTLFGFMVPEFGHDQ
ncbi:fungal-specific transcription factor domain-containing protein [Penicillium solitum]|uniref:fungal-specific transcription factor domain-containing protein n=1 Tax=Penicillium solitum TaxID=60172 RepID=UPI0032C4913E|nr:fungal-specific transcription factor domain-containing protein [Penicillium solitum]